MLNSFLHRYLRSIFDKYEYTARSGLSKGMRRQGGFGFIPSFKDGHDLESKFLMNLDLEGKILFDIGGWEGVFALFFSKMVGENGKVVVFEPNPMNCRKIQANVRLNHLKNVVVVSYAVGSVVGEAGLIFDKRITSRGTMLESIASDVVRDNISRSASTIQVPVITLDDYIYYHHSDIPQFVKIDVEGFEWEVLKGMEHTLQEYRPDLWIELHDEFLDAEDRNGFKILEFLIDKNYVVSHIETQSVLNLNLSLPTKGHLYCHYKDK